MDASRPGGIIARIRKPDGEIERVVLDESGGIYRGDLGLLDPGDYRIEELSADLGARAPHACPLEHSFTVVDSVPFSAALQDSTVTADEVTVRLAITSNAVTLGQTIAVTSSVQGRSSMPRASPGARRVGQCHDLLSLGRSRRR